MSSHGMSYYMYRRPNVGTFSIRPQFFIANCVTLFVVIFVFEEAVYGRLALGSTTYLIAKTATEAFLYFFLLLVILHQLTLGQILSYKPTFFDFCLSFFLVLAIVSTLINHGSMVQGIFNVRTMLRYIAIYYIIVLSGWVPSERQIKMFISILVWIALLQSFIITLQHFAGSSFREAYFSPLKIEVAISGVSKNLGWIETKLGAGYGTFGKPALASYYLLFVAVIAVAVAVTVRYGRSIRWWVAYAIILVGIYFSYKRAPLLLALMTPMLVEWIYGRKRLLRRHFLLVMLVMPFAFLILSNVKPEYYVKEKKEEIAPIESLAQLFSEEYWSIASTKQRGWMITEVGREAFSSLKLVGYGADKENAKAELAKKGGEFSKLVGWGAFDDVYIVACIVYYGPIGVVILLSAFYYIYRRGRSLACVQSPPLQIVGTSLAAIMILMFFSVFVVRLFEFRAVAFMFWVFAGIAIAVSRR